MLQGSCAVTAGAGNSAGESNAPQPNTPRLNIAIHQEKDFPVEATPLADFFCEFCMLDGRTLFECQSLIKTSGIDLMNCPLNVVLKLRVRRRDRSTQSSQIWWHVVLPLGLISKYLMNEPYEWETWIGLLPAHHDLDHQPPETSFSQAVSVISRPEFPKLRLKFTYFHPELREQMTQHLQQLQISERIRTEQNQLVGRQNFEELQKTLTRGAPSSGVCFDAALASAVSFIEEVRKVAEYWSRALGRFAPPLPPPLDAHAAARSYAVEAQCVQLRRALEVLLPTVGAAGGGSASGGSGAVDECKDVEVLLSEGLRMAMFGMLEDRSTNGSTDGRPRTMTNLSEATTLQRAALQSRYPELWDACREVSTLVNERVSLIERERQLQDEGVGGGSASLAGSPGAPPSSDQSSEASGDIKRQFERLLTQQRRSLQVEFEKEMSQLRQESDVLRRTVDEHEAEAMRLRAEVARQNGMRSS